MSDPQMAGPAAPTAPSGSTDPNVTGALIEGAGATATSSSPSRVMWSAPGALRASDIRSAAATIQRFGARLRRAELAAKRGRLIGYKAAVLAPARAAVEALHAMAKYGETAADGISPTRQFAALWWLRLRYGYEGYEVYRFRLFSRARAFPRPLFLRWADASLLYRTTVARGGASAAQILADKRRFAAWCAEQGLPTAPILLAFEGGRVTQRNVADGAVPPVDLFAKWGTRYGGDATQRWRYRDGVYLDDEDGAWSFDEIVDALAARSEGGVVLLQPRLANHAALRALSPNALSTIRVVTLQRPDGEPEFFAAILRMGTGTATADNFAQGGIASPIDPATGTLAVARRADEGQRTWEYTAHPDTGATLEGFAVPFWNEAVALALEGHRRLGKIASVGWDVAVLENGPALIEGNWNPCTKLMQVATQTPLLATEFARTYAAWLAEPACASADDRWLVSHATWSPV